MTNDPSPSPKLESDDSDKKPPEVRRKRKYDDAILLLVLAAMIGGVFLLADETVVTVKCDEIEGGTACTLTRTKGSTKNVEVCWEVNRVCSNGQKSAAKRCHAAPIESGASGSSVIARSEFSDYKNCPKVVATSIENIKVSAK